MLERRLVKRLANRRVGRDVELDADLVQDHLDGRKALWDRRRMEPQQRRRGECPVHLFGNSDVGGNHTLGDDAVYVERLLGDDAEHLFAGHVEPQLGLCEDKRALFEALIGESVRSVAETTKRLPGDSNKRRV